MNKTFIKILAAALIALLLLPMFAACNSEGEKKETETPSKDGETNDISSETDKATDETEESQTDKPISTETNKPATDESNKPSASESGNPDTVNPPNNNKPENPEDGDSEAEEPKEFVFEEAEGGYALKLYNGTTLEVVIPSVHNEKAVVMISGNAFANSKDIISVTIPSSVTSIESYAFDGCSKLTSIEIPDEVNSIGFSAFRGCSSLESLTIPFAGNTKDGTENTNFGYIFGAEDYSHNSEFVPAALKSVVITSAANIPYRAFENCSTLTSVTLSDSVKIIGSYAFSGCNGLTNVTFSPNSSLETIGSSAFYDCSLLANILIPASVKEIQSYAFSDCVGLESITFAEGALLEAIGAYAFSNCKKIENIIIPDGVTSIGSSAFKGCIGLLSMTIPFIGESKKTASDTFQYPLGYLFGNHPYAGGIPTSQRYYKSSTSSITSEVFYIPASLTSVTVKGGEILFGAFEGCYSILSITISEDVTNINENAFCPKLVEVYNLSGLEISSNFSVARHTYTSLSVPSKIFFNENGYVFYENGEDVYLLGYVGNDTDLTLPNNFNNKDYEIYQYAFRSRHELKSVKIPNGVTKIRSSAFEGCYNLKEVIIGNEVTSIEDYAFNKCTSLITITVPEAVYSIGSGAFYNCAKLTEIYNLSDVKIYENGNGNGFPHVYTSLSEQSKITETADGYIFYENGETVYLLGYSGNKTELILPDKFNDKNYEIYQYAFSYNDKITSVVMPDSIIGIIGAYAFYQCTELSSIIISNNVSYIYNYSFGGCRALKSIVIPQNIVYIATSAFSQCYIFEVYNLPNVDIFGIFPYAFDTYTSLSAQSKISTTSDGYIFYENGETVYLLGYIGNKTNLILPNKFNNKNYEIYSYAFYGNENLISIEIPGYFIGMFPQVFKSCIKLTSIKFNGTKSEWENLIKANEWDANTGNYTVFCTDGKLDKSGNVITE